MARKEHLNYDLFGDVIPEPPTVTPVEVKPRDFVITYHASESANPPHLQDHPRLREHLRGISGSPFTSNQSNEILHMGTIESARERNVNKAGRPRLLHSYKIPKSLLDVVHKDSDAPVPDYNFSGPLQMSLWENTVKPVSEVETGNTVVPYLNQFEHAGSTSYMVPKHLIRSGQIEYLGIHGAPK